MSTIGYAIVACDGGQMKVREGDTVLLDSGTVGEKVELEGVLALRSASGLKTGSPYVKGASVICVIEKEVAAPKISVVKFKKRKGYRRKTGHRQKYVSARVETIKGGTKAKAAKKETKQEGD